MSGYYKINWANGGNDTENYINPQDSSIFIGDIPHNLTDDEVANLFSIRYRSYSGIKLIKDNNRNVRKGFGFVYFSNYEESQKAIREMNG